MTSKYDKPWESPDAILIAKLKKRIAELEAELAEMADIIRPKEIIGGCDTLTYSDNHYWALISCIDNDGLMFAHRCRKAGHVSILGKSTCPGCQASAPENIITLKVLYDGKLNESDT